MKNLNPSVMGSSTRKKSMGSPLVVAVVVALHIAAAGSVMFIQGCRSTEPRVEPPPAPVMPPRTAPPSTGLAPLAPVPAPGSSMEQPVAMPVSEIRTYTIRKGDSLSKIASRYGVSYRELADLNGIKDANKIKIGQELVLPAHASKSASVSSSKPAPRKPVVGASAGKYVVKPGDSLSVIAVAHGVKTADLKAVNGLTSDRILVGQKLAIPEGGKKPVAVPAATKPASRPVATTTVAPAAAAPVVTPAPEPEPAASPEPQLKTQESGFPYVVGQGDTLEKVAQWFLVSKEDVVRLNNLGPNDELKPGQVIRIPDPQD